MSLDPALRQLAVEFEDATSFPSPRCPECGVGTVSFSVPRQFETAGMRAARQHEAYDPEWENGTFLAEGECSKAACRQIVTVAGSWRADYGTSHGYAASYSELYSIFFRVHQVFPALRILELPESVALDEALGGVAEGLSMAGSVVFSAPGLAATALRGCVERFLSNEGIPKLSAKAKFRPLEDRLMEWRQQDINREGIADLMLAVKWLGNAGAHEYSTLTAIDVLDGARFLDEAFHQLYVSPAIKAAAAIINANWGPA